MLPLEEALVELDPSLRTSMTKTHEHEIAIRISDQQHSLNPMYYTQGNRHSVLRIENIQDDAIALYFLHNHPTLPIVDEDDFMRSYQSYIVDERCVESINRILIQAVLLVGVSVSISPSL